MSRRRRVLARSGFAALAVASVAIGVTTTRTLADVQADHSSALAATTLSRTARAALDDELDQVEQAIGIIDGATERDSTDAKVLDDATTLLGRMRDRIARVQADIEAKTAESRERQQPIALLMSCQQVLQRAITRLQGPASDDRVAAATAELASGSDTCQRALELARGANGSVHPYDLPDPYVLPLSDLGYLAFGTNGPAGPVQVLASPDLRSWKVLQPALTAVPGWAEPGYSWAPSVAKVDDGWVLYYATRERGTKRQCISSATAKGPAGPYVDDTRAPLICQRDQGGSIDPSPYRDELGFQHLTWKSEGEANGGRARIWTQILAGDGRTLLGSATELLVADRPWEDGTIENPSMAKIGDRWVLLYSGNRWNSADYAMGYAVCAGAMGPCTRPEQEVVVRTTAAMEGPGGGELFHAADGSLKVAFAAWDRGAIGFPNARRLHLATARLTPLGLVID